MHSLARKLALVTAGVTALGALGIAGSARAMTYPVNPVIALNRTIPGDPFPGSNVSAHDNEGSAYVPGDDSLWIVDDNGKSAYELNRATGELKRQIDGAEFQAVPQLGGSGQQTDDNRYSDLESAAYDQATDTLYFFSGHCCLAAPLLNKPSVFRLQRDSNGDFQLDSYQPLPETADATASAIRPDGVLWTGHKDVIQTYDYPTNTFGPELHVSGSSVGNRIYGMVFASQNDLFLVSKTEKLSRVSMTTLGPVANWPAFDLTPYGILDARSVEIVGNQFFIGDGNDFRNRHDPLRYATFVFDLAQLEMPTAGFSASTNHIRGPVTIGFLDESTGSINSHLWNFGDGTATSTEASPFHLYTTAGTFTVTETVTNAAGSDTATHQITVLESTYRSGGYTLDGFGGLHPFRVGTGPAPPAVSGGPYWNGWDIARGTAVLPSGTGGYVLDGFGGVHPFRVGPHARAAAIHGGPYWLGWDIARGIAVLPNGTGGYVLDGYGGLHPFSIGTGALPPAVKNAPYWPGRDMAQGLALRPDGSSGYVLDRTGALHPFTIGTGTLPPTPTHVFVSTTRILRGAALLSDGRGGMTVDGNGIFHRFMIDELPPATVGAASWAAWDIARDVAVLPG